MGKVRRGGKALRFFKGLFKFLLFILVCMGVAVGGTYVYNNYIKESRFSVHMLFPRNKSLLIMYDKHT